DVRELGNVLEREKASAGILITLETPTKPMLDEAARTGTLPNPPGLKLTAKFPKLQIVTIQEVMDGVKMNLPLAEEVFKSAKRAGRRGKNRE
ncbi:MAG: hypothetical protein FWE67_14675, partial [Planctomycetaceae bacterium]|nr:hypothetical protein [Planctomycetaceae bacterium]